MTNDQILNLPMGANDASAATVRDYLKKLLHALWIKEECFSGKRPFGNSGWKSDVNKVLISHGLIDGEIDSEEGWINRIDRKAADDIVVSLIESL